MKLLPFSPESHSEPGSPLAILRRHVADVANSVRTIEGYVGATATLNNKSSGHFFNSGYTSFMEDRARQSNVATQREVEVVPIVPVNVSSETILDGGDDFDAHAWDLAADQAVEAPALVYTPFTSPADQEVELQTIIMSAEETKLAQLSQAAKDAAVTRGQANAHITETAQRD